MQKLKTRRGDAALLVFLAAIALGTAPLGTGSAWAQAASTREGIARLEAAPAPVGTLQPVAPETAASPEENATPEESALSVAESATRELAPHQEIARRLGEGLPDGLPPQTPQQRQAILEGQRAAQKWAREFLAKKRLSGASGNGVLVAAPVARGALDDQSVADFAEGCTRWLQVELSGQGELGRMPPWGDIDNAAASMGKAGIAAQGSELARLARLCAVTHFVSTTLQSNATRSRLTLQLWTVEGKKVGAPLSLAGSQTQILAALPDAARKIAALLGVAHPAVTAPGVTPEEMAFLGRVEWRSPRVSEYSPTPAMQRLQRLADKTPLAGLLWCYSDPNASLVPQWRRVAAAMMRLAPRHPLMMATLSLRAARYSKPYRKSIETLRRRFPRNVLLAVEESGWHEYRGDPEKRAAAATRLVALVPQDTLAWAQLADAYAAKAQRIRRSRVLGALTPPQRELVFTLYQAQVMMSLEATRLNPNSVSGWKSLLHGAMLAGDPALGDAALWTGLELAGRNRARYRNSYWLYALGLSFYQPQWHDDPARLRKVGQLVAQDAVTFIWLARPLQSALFNEPFSPERDAMLNAFFEQCDLLMKAQPKDGFTYVVCAERALEVGEYEKAADAYEKWLAAEPDNFVTIVGYADLIRRHQPRLHRRSYAFMEELFRKAMKRAPNDAGLTMMLGMYQRDVNRNFDRAAPLLRRAMTLDPYDSQAARELAVAYWSLKDDESNATRYFKEAEKRNPNDSEVHVQWARQLKKRGRTVEAQQHAWRAAALGEVWVTEFGIR